MSKIALIITSTRTPRVGPSVATWLAPILTSTLGGSHTLSTVDVADFKLPVFDEVVTPAAVPKYAQYTKPHAIAWSTEIAKYDAYVLLANEYNFGPSASTKNAIDYVYNEWTGKPILLVTYGIHGGNKASDALNETLAGMKLRVCETRPQLKFKDGNKGQDMLMAMSGQLGEGSKEAWEIEKKADIEKGVEELKVLLATEHKVEVAW